MTVPKRRQSRSRRDSRRAQAFRLKNKTVAKCGHCSQPIVPHRVCPHCGYYGGVEVIKVDEE
jgi:large subunit ribosomal protein L32